MMPRPPGAGRELEKRSVWQLGMEIVGRNLFLHQVSPPGSQFHFGIFFLRGRLGGPEPSWKGDCSLEEMQLIFRFRNPLNFVVVLGSSWREARIRGSDNGKETQPPERIDLLLSSLAFSFSRMKFNELELSLRKGNLPERVASSSWRRNWKERREKKNSFIILGKAWSMSIIKIKREDELGKMDQTEQRTTLAASILTTPENKIDNFYERYILLSWERIL